MSFLSSSKDTRNGHYNEREVSVETLGTLKVMNDNYIATRSVP